VQRWVGKPSRRIAGRHDEYGGTGRASELGTKGGRGWVDVNHGHLHHLDGRGRVVGPFPATAPPLRGRMTVPPSRHAPSGNPDSARRILGTSAFGDASRVARLRLSRAPSTGFFKDHLSVVLPSGASSRGVSPASARSCHRPDMFRPRGFSPPRRLAPPEDLRACCIPLPTLRFTGFRAPGQRVPARPLAFPHRAMPSRAYPPAAADPASPRRRASLPSPTRR